MKLIIFAIDMDVDKYIRAVRKYLKEEKRIMKVDDLAIELLRHNLETLEKINQQLVKGVTATDRYGNTIPSPFLRVKNDIEARIESAIKHLGLSPAARKRLAVETGDEESLLERFMDKSSSDEFNLPNQLDLFDPDDYQ